MTTLRACLLEKTNKLRHGITSMEYGLIFYVTRIGKYYCKNMKYRINIYIYRYVYRYVCGPKTNLNHTLVIDSPFRTFTVGLLVQFIELYHCFLQKCFPRRVNQGFSYIMHTLLYLSGWMTQLPAQTHL